MNALSISLDVTKFHGVKVSSASRGEEKLKEHSFLKSDLSVVDHLGRKRTYKDERVD